MLMVRGTKNSKRFAGLYDLGCMYDVVSAVNMVKEMTFTKFDASVDVAIKLNVDPKKGDQMIRGTVVLPNGVGKQNRILVVCSNVDDEKVKNSGADYIGSDDILKKIESGWCDFDVLITTPDMMARVGRLGKILGPRGLMPNPKSGTITQDVEKTVKEFKVGRVEYRVDKFGVVHNSIGKVSFSNEKLVENVRSLVSAIIKSRPSTVKGNFIESLSISSTMSRGVFVKYNAL